MVAAGRFIGGVGHLAALHDGDPGGAAADIHHAGVIELQQVRHRGRFIEYVTHL